MVDMSRESAAVEIRKNFLESSFHTKEAEGVVASILKGIRLERKITKGELVFRRKLPDNPSERELFPESGDGGEGALQIKDSTRPVDHYEIRNMSSTKHLYFKERFIICS